MQNPDGEAYRAAKVEVLEARQEAARAMARLAAASVGYADAGLHAAQCASAADLTGPGRGTPGEFVPDQLSLLLREQPYAVRRLLTRTRRLRTGLPTVWAAYRAGELDAEQVRVIDRVTRRVTEAHTRAAIDDQVVDAAQTRCPKQLGAWLLRLVVRLEPLAFAERHRRALADRRVTVIQGADGMGYVTGEVSAADAAQIDALLAGLARTLGADDPRTDQQRRSDLFADLLLGRLHLVDSPVNGTAEDEDLVDDSDIDDSDDPDTDADDSDDVNSDDVDTDGDAVAGNEDRSRDREQAPQPAGWLEVEDIDPDTGELLGTHWQPVDTSGDAAGEPIGEAPSTPPFAPAFQRRPQIIRIGVVVPLSSLLGLTDAPAELPDRSGLIPAEQLRQLIADTLDPDGDHPDPRDQILFTRLLTDDGGRLLDTTELGRFPSRRLAEAVRLRAGTCCFPTCTVPADRCDIDHHQRHPNGPTAGPNLGPGCRRHHRGVTFAWQAATRDDDGVDWTMPDAERYRCSDEPLPV